MSGKFSKSFDSYSDEILLNEIESDEDVEALKEEIKKAFYAGAAAFAALILDGSDINSAIEEVRAFIAESLIAKDKLTQ